MPGVHLSSCPPLPLPHQDYGGELQLNYGQTSERLLNRRQILNHVTPCQEVLLHFCVPFVHGMHDVNLLLAPLSLHCRRLADLEGFLSELVHTVQDRLQTERINEKYTRVDR